MELFAADGHDAGGCERVTGKSGMRPGNNAAMAATRVRRNIRKGTSSGLRTFPAHFSPYLLTNHPLNEYACRIRKPL